MVLGLGGLAATLLGTLSGGTAHAAPAAAAAPQATVVAGYANVFVGSGTGFQPVNAGDVHTTSGQGAQVLRFQSGFYQVKFPGLGQPGLQSNVALPGVVHAYGNWGDSCQPVTEPLSDGLGGVIANVRCSDRFGAAVDTPFDINYTRGGTQQGTLDTVRVSATEVQTLAAQGAVTPKVQQSSVANAAITVTRNPGEVAGIYRFTLPRLPGSRPHALTVSPTGGSPSAVCVINEAKPDATGANELVRVVCRTATPSGAVETPLSLTFAEDTGTLGLTSESFAYLIPPSFATPSDCTQPGPVLAVTNGRNVFRGVSGAMTFQRLCVGQYVITLENQGRQLTNTGNVSAHGFTADRRCSVPDDFTIPGTTTRQLRVVCGDQFGNVRDGAFQLNYTARQQ